MRMILSTSTTAFLLSALLLIGCQDKAPASPSESASGETATLEGQLNSIQQRLGALEARMEKLESGQEDTSEELGRLTRLPKKLEQVSAELESARERERRPIPPKPSVENGAAGGDSEEAVEREEVAHTPETLEPEEPIPATQEEDGEETEEEALGDQQPAQPPEESGVSLTEAGESPIKVLDLQFASSVNRKKRRPEEPKQEFTPSEEKVYAWLILSNDLEEDSKIVVTWKREGKQKSFIELRVGKSATHWRTWCYTRLKSRSVGNWTVEVTDLDGHLLASGSFKVNAEN